MCRVRLPVDGGGGFRFNNAMNRAGTPTVAELMALLAAHAAEITALKAERDVLAQRVFKLEEELALARLHRFAPRSEKHMDRVFNEAEQVAREADADRAAPRRMPLNFRTRDCRTPKSRTAGNPAAGPCRQTCRASASNMTLPTTRRSVRAAATRCIAWASW